MYNSFQQKPELNGRRIINLDQNNNTEEEEDMAMMDLPDEMEYSLDQNKQSLNHQQNKNEII